jgi:cytochrome b involved in lipid metabolism
VGNCLYEISRPANLHILHMTTINLPPEQVLTRLVAQRRLCLEVFTSHAAADRSAEGRSFWPSELCIHNNESDGWWMAIEARVLDVGEFRNLHPGGPVLTEGYCGFDSTQVRVTRSVAGFPP